MNALAYDAFSVSSDGSAPRTPSPGSSLALDDPAYALSSSPAASFEPVFGIDGFPSTSAFHLTSAAGMRHTASVDVAPSWQHNMHGGPMLQPVQASNRGTLLQELYDHELPPEHVSQAHGHPPHDAYFHQSAEPQYGPGGADWSTMTPPTSSHGLPGSPHALPPMRSPHEGMIRRNTFPYVRHDQDANGMPFAPHPPPHYVDHPHMLAPFGRPDMVYGEPMGMAGPPGSHMPLAAEPSALHAPRLDDGHVGHMPHYDPHGYHHHGMDDSSVKLEEGGPVMIPPQPFYRPPSTGGMPMSYLSPHTGLPIQHTDDAASKETQYLRRRCFNCHTTEPPSWRRSTLNPGKIVCNKCGLYERTHLRPRPLRFDELRAGNKARKAATKTASPKQRPIKKDSADGISRRASVSSNASSIGGSSDWDDGASAYSTGSSSSFNSPAQSTFSIPRDSASASPPMANAEGGIRLPTGGLNDIAAMPSPMGRDAAHMPHKSASGPAPSQYYQSYGPVADAHGARRNTVNLPLNSPVPADAVRRPLSSHGDAAPAAEQWSGLAAEDVTPTGPPTASPKPLAVA